MKQGQPDWKPGTMKKYLMELSKKEASLIFKARTRMIKVKSNYKNMFKNNLNCRACGQAEESQEHILNQCHKIHSNNQRKVKSEDFFEDEPQLLRRTAFKIETAMTILETHNVNIPRNNQNNTRRTIQTNCGAPTLTPRDGGGAAQRSACTQ